MIFVLDSDLEISITTLKKIVNSNFVTISETHKIKQAIQTIQEILDDSAILVDQRPTLHKIKSQRKSFINHQGRII